MTGPEIYDALVIGGGPAGATAALVMARAGLRVRVLERTRFPRFHIGEYLLPRNVALFRELGLEERLRELPRVEKLGAAFVTADGRHQALFPFDGGLTGGEAAAFNVERAPFDALLLDAARNVFPGPVFALRWRVKLFELFVALNRAFPLVPRRERFSLLDEPEAAGPAGDPQALASAG